MEKQKLRRGQKLCKSCGAVNASRSLKCNTCGKQFISKNTPIKNEIKDWTTLGKADCIRIVQGTGPYFISSRDTEEVKRGEKIYMGVRGKYKVLELTHNGIMAVGIGKNNTGLEFVYMGEKTYSESTGITKVPHRIVKIKTPRVR